MSAIRGVSLPPLYIRQDYLQSSGDEKGKLKDLFKKVQNELFLGQGLFGAEENNRAYKLSSWDPFSHDKADWFDPKWMYGVDNFDIVIGNPPYVQMQKDKGELANRYKGEGYKTYERTGDIYSLFYERGFQLLNNKSILCYITSNQWMRAKYGETLREHFLEKNPLILVNLGPGVFQSATVDTNILIVENNDYNNDFNAINIIKGSQINHLTKGDMQKMSNINNGRWSIDTKEESYISQKILEKGKLLLDWDVVINRGVLTGFNEAFIISKDKRDELVNQDRNSANILKPILKGKDITKFQTEWNRTYIVSTFPALNIDIDEYPVVKNYLESFQPRLNQTGDKYIDDLGEQKKCRKKTGNKWFETQDKIGYHEDFAKEKVIWKRIGSSLRFTFSKEEIFSLDSTCLATGEKMKYLTAYLNSKLGNYQLFKSAPKTGMGDLIISVQALNPLLVYYPSDKQENQFNKIVNYIIILLKRKDSLNPHVPNSHIVLLFEEVIDAMVMELYFDEDFKKEGIEFIKYVERDFKSIEELKTEEEKIEVIHQAYQTLRQKDNEIRNNLKLMDIKLADIVMPIKTAK